MRQTIKLDKSLNRLSKFNSNTGYRTQREKIKVMLLQQ